MLNRKISVTLNVLLSEDPLYKIKVSYNSDFDLTLQWNLPIIQEVADVIKRSSKEPCPTYFSNTFKVIEDQPTWDLKNPPIKGKKEMPPEGLRHYEKEKEMEEMPPEGLRHYEKGKREKERIEGLKKAHLKNLKKTSYEQWGYYVPAHINLENYGIYLNIGCILKIAAEIKNNFGISQETYGSKALKIIDCDIIAAMEMVFWHEITHAWIEDLCSIAEDISGYDFYTKTHKKFNGYIFMEEAICNSSAFGMLNFLFRGNECPKPSLLNAIENIMLSQPRGYRNFIPLRWWSANNELFQKNVFLLLCKIYNVPEDLAMHSLRIFFDPTEFTFPRLYRYMERNNFYEHCFNSFYMLFHNYPSYFV